MISIHNNDLDKHSTNIRAGNYNTCHRSCGSNTEDNIENDVGTGTLSMTIEIKPVQQKPQLIVTIMVMKHAFFLDDNDNIRVIRDRKIIFGESIISIEEKIINNRKYCLKIILNNQRISILYQRGLNQLQQKFDNKDVTMI